MTTLMPMQLHLRLEISKLFSGVSFYHLASLMKAKLGSRFPRFPGPLAHWLLDFLAHWLLVQKRSLNVVFTYPRHGRLVVDDPCAPHYSVCFFFL